MLWLLIASIALNVFLLYAWLHDSKLWRGMAERYERAYHDTLDSYCGNPKGTTMRRLAESWPEGSELRRRDEAKYCRRYGELPS